MEKQWHQKSHTYCPGQMVEVLIKLFIDNTEYPDLMEIQNLWGGTSNCLSRPSGLKPLSYAGGDRHLYLSTCIPFTPVYF